MGGGEKVMRKIEPTAPFLSHSIFQEKDPTRDKCLCHVLSVCAILLYFFNIFFDQFLPVGEAKQELMNQPKWGS
jgi:hypothetical protein